MNWKTDPTIPATKKSRPTIPAPDDQTLSFDIVCESYWREYINFIR